MTDMSMFVIKIGSKKVININDCSYSVCYKRGSLKIQVRSNPHNKEKVVEYVVMDDKNQRKCGPALVVFMKDKIEHVLGTFKCVSLFIFMREIETLVTVKKYLSFKSTFIDDFNRFFNKDDTKDVKFKIGAKEIMAHKFILSARSPVFERMFVSDMNEQQGKVIELTDVTFEDFVCFLKFIYGDNYQSEGNTTELLYLADKYDVQGLKIKTANTLLENIRVENAIDTIILFDRYQMFSLTKEAVKFIVANRNEIYSEEVKMALKNSNIKLFELIEVAMHVTNFNGKDATYLGTVSAFNSAKDVKDDSDSDHSEIDSGDESE